MNMMAVSYGETTVVVDAGAMFPGPELLGVDLIVPDLTYLQGRRVTALVLTHGHEDHIGGVPYVWPLVDGPVYGTPFTLALVEPKLDEHEIDAADRLRPVKPGERVRVGAFEIEFLRVTHSIPDCVALAIHTPAGTIVHTGDFKVDQTPLDGQHFDLHRFATLGSEGVLALFADSTNIDRPGFTGSELEVVGAFEEIFTSATGHAGRGDVRLEPVSHAGPGAAGRALRPEGRVRWPRRWCRTPRSRCASATCRCPRACRFATARWRRSRRARSSASPPDRRASRDRRCRGSPSTITAT